MTIQIKVTASREAPPHGSTSYRHYIQGNVYGPDTDPPATLSLVRRALAEGWAVAWPPDDAGAQDPPETVDLRPLVDTLPPIDPDLLLRALGPLPEGVHYLAGYCTGDCDDDYRQMGATEVTDSVDECHECGGLFPDAEIGEHQASCLGGSMYPPVEPIAAFDDSDAIHKPQEAASESPGPDVQPAPVEAPETPTTTGAKPRMRGGR